MFMATFPAGRTSDAEAYDLDFEESSRLFAYVGADPINFVDPLGLQAEGPAEPPPEPPPIVVTGSRCPAGWTCYDPGFGFQTLQSVSTGEIVVTASRGGGGRGRRSTGRSVIEILANKVACSIESFSIGGDFALGLGPVLRGSGGLQWNQHTGRVSWYRSLGVGYGVALSGGLLSGSGSTGERRSGYSYMDTAQGGAALVLGGSRSVNGPDGELGFQVSAGARAGFEISRTENKTHTYIPPEEDQHVPGGN